MEKRRHPGASEFLDEVMRRVGATNPSDLSRRLGGRWLERDMQRKLYKWARGEAAPNFESTVALLTAAGLLADQPATIADPATSQDATLADLLVERMQAMEKTQGEILVLVERLSAAVGLNTMSLDRITGRVPGDSALRPRRRAL